MAKTIVSAFIFAAAVILSASAFAPSSIAQSDDGCDPAYGIAPCQVTVAR